MKSILLSHRSRQKTLHIEAPGVIVNIQIGLADAEGREVTHVSVSADGDRYAGNAPWWVDGIAGCKGDGFRIVKCAKSSNE